MKTCAYCGGRTKGATCPGCGRADWLPAVVDPDPAPPRRPDGDKSAEGGSAAAAAGAAVTRPAGKSAAKKGAPDGVPRRTRRTRSA